MRLLILLIFLFFNIDLNSQFYKKEKIAKSIADVLRFDINILVANINDTLCSIYSDELLNGRKSKSYYYALQNLTNINKFGTFKYKKIDSIRLKYIIEKWDSCFYLVDTSYYLKTKYLDFIPELSLLLSLNNSNLYEGKKSKGCGLKVVGSSRSFMFIDSFRNDPKKEQFPIYIKEIDNLLYSFDFVNGNSISLKVGEKRHWAVEIPINDSISNKQKYDSIDVIRGMNRLIKIKYYNKGVLEKSTIYKISNQKSTIIFKGQFVFQGQVSKEIKKSAYQLTELQTFVFTIPQKFKYRFVNL
jgi:hypothetical protein